MTVKQEIQKLEPSALIELYEMDGTEFGAGTVRFQGQSDGSIVWQGNSYGGWPIKASGFARTSEQQPQPKLVVGNVNGAISQLCMAYDDMVGAVIRRRVTFKKFLDAVNFTEGNPTADPTQEFPVETWYIERKAGESNESVEFDLSSALEFGAVKLPRRQILANFCPSQWVYRGENCGYTGPPVADLLDQPTTDPDLDRCGKRLASCKLRVWPDGVLNFGGFPAAGLVRT